MIIRPQSLQSFKHTYNYPVQNNFDLRKKIENFTFLPTDKIGRGYSSTVYKGQNEITKQPVAIKVIELKSLRDQNTKRFLTNELQCLRRLDHPNVLKYINSFMTANNCYIITQIYNGGDLSKLLKQKGRFSEDEVFEFFYQFFSGYEHFSQNGYIHRDIKPSNILIRVKNQRQGLMENKNGRNSLNCNKNSQQRQYVIADFGFIKYQSENPKDSFNVGTPVYMSPESITSNIYTIKSDIWSMGVMLYELIYGDLPFSSRSQSDLKRQICNKQLKIQDIQNQKGISTSSEFKGFLLSCLRKNPQNRISLEEISQHQWFKKYLTQNYHNKINLYYVKNHSQLMTSPSYDLNLRINNINNKNNQFVRQPILNLSTPNQDQQKYGYIGNVAVKREKSLQANHFALKNCYKNSPIVNKENVDVSIERHREKARLLLGVLNQKIERKDLRSGSRPTQQYFINNNQNFKLKLNNTNPLITDSPKLQMLLEKKNGMQQGSSLLQGMKGIVNIKNSQLLKINNFDTKLNRNSTKNEINPRLSYQKFEKVSKKVNNLQSSTSLQSNKFDSQNSLKQNQGYRIKSPIVTSFNSLPSEKIQLRKVHTQVINDSVGNMENNSFIANGLQNISLTFLSNQLLPSQPSVQITEKKIVSHTAQEYCLKILHLLRYIYQTLTLIYQYKGQSAQNFIEAKQLLQTFFIKLFVKLKKAIITKQNVLNLQKWSKFIESEKYQNFVDVIKKYETKYGQGAVIGQRMRQYSQICDYLSFPSSQNLQSFNFDLLKLAQNLSSTNKETTKKSLRSSNSFNQIIIMIFNIHKCLQMMLKFIQTQQLTQALNKIDPQKDLQEMTIKSKDPFKIPKMIIYLKKKLILLQSGTFIEQSKKEIIHEKVGRPKREHSTKKIPVL